MKRLLSSVLLGCLMLSQSVLQPVPALSQGMYDDAIEYVRDQGIAQGYLDGSFRPEQSINRAEFAKIIMLAVSDEGGMNGSNCFRDVRNEWFAPYVCEARDHGMVSGYQDGTFRPAQDISFAEASSLIAKAYHGNMSGGGEWYTPYVRQLDEWDAIPPTVGMVHDPLTRGEMAYIIMMADHARDGGSHSSSSRSSSSRNDEDDEDEDDDEDVEIDLSVRTLQTEAAETEYVTFIITAENDGGDGEIDIEATLDGNLEYREAPGHDDRSGNTVSWEDIRLDDGDETSFVLVASVRPGAAGKTLRVDVEAEGEDASATIVVKAGRPTQPISPVGDPVLHWNYIANLAVAHDHSGSFGNPDNGGPGPTARAMAIAHIAMYDAVNSVDRTHQRYVAYIPLQPNEKINLDSAVAYAAHRTLSALYPRQKPLFDASLQSHMNKVPESAEKTAGIRVGEAAAAQILATRQNDGSVNDNAYTFGNQPGQHRVDPINPNQGIHGAKWGQVKPFAIQSGSQFRAPPPPAITSPEYAAAFNEVKMMGSDGVSMPSSRTHDQSEIGLYWGYDGATKLGTPPRLYNQIVRVIALQEGNTVAENARLFALVNIAMADAGIASWESKYVYNYWRPVVGIREADEGTGPTGLGDGNPQTAGYANWEPVGAPNSNAKGGDNFTPPFPAYPSGHATFGAAAFHAVANFYGTDEIPFTFMSDEMNGVTTDNNGVIRPFSPRSFTRLSQAVQENADSRIYLGVHWRFDATAGIDMGNKIADYMNQNILRPVR